MSEVSTIVLRDVIRMLRARSVDPQSAFDGLSPGLGVTETTLERMSWADFTVLIERAEKALGGPEGLRRCGTETVGGVAFFRILARALIHPRALSIIGVRWVGPMAFRCTRGEEFFDSDGGYGQRVTILPGFAKSAPFFHYMHGVIESGPCLLGLPPAKVTLESDGREAIYSIAFRGLDERTARESFDAEATLAIVEEFRSVSTEAAMLDSMKSAPSQDEFLERVSWLIKHELSNHEAGWSITEVATRAGMSERTLKRRLRALGTSYSEVLDDQRCALAIEMLRSAESTEDVTQRLGFSEPSSFRRAFKRWTGKTPAEVRNGLDT